MSYVARRTSCALSTRSAMGGASSSPSFRFYKCLESAKGYDGPRASILTSNWHPKRTTNIISPEFVPTLNADFQYIYARKLYVVRESIAGPPAAYIKKGGLEERVELWEDLGWTIGDEFMSSRHVNFGDGAPTWVRWSPDVILSHAPMPLIASQSAEDKASAAAVSAYLGWAVKNDEVDNALRDHGIACEHLGFCSGGGVIREGHKLYPTLTTYWVWSDNAQEWCVIDATREDVGRDLDACPVVVSASVIDKYVCDSPLRKRVVDADVLPRAPKPPVGRPVLTPEQAQKLLASRKDVPVPTKGTPEAKHDTSKSGSGPSAALVIGVGAAVAGGVGLLALWHRSNKRTK